MVKRLTREAQVIHPERIMRGDAVMEEEKKEIEN